MAKKYKILSLDGGGSWAILQVLTLEKIFQKKYPNKIIKGHEVLKHFDLVIANSGGSMVLAALSCNWTFKKILDLFQKEEITSAIFTKLKRKEQYFPTNLLRFFGVKNLGAKYSTTKKKQALVDLLLVNDKKPLNEINLAKLPNIIGKDSLEIIVVTFDIINRRAKFFRSNKNSKARAEIIANHNYFDEVSLVEAIHGSSNAPINYFDFPAVFSPKNTRKRFYLWDGALGGFNNPVEAGLTEALANGINREDIYILSLGTASKIASNKIAQKFRDEYYGTLFRKKIKHNQKGHIDFKETLKKGTFLDRLIKKPKKYFIGLNFFKSTLSNMSQSILFEPQTWSNYSTCINLFSGNLNKNDNEHRFIRLSPQIINDESDEFIRQLYNLDMDITEKKELDLIIKCFDKWEKSEIINEPIQWSKTINGDYIFAKGHQTFNDAMNDLNWL